MYLMALVRNKKTKQTEVITRENYTSKKKFARDLRANGYAVISILNKRDIAAQEDGFKTFKEMKKFYEEFYATKPNIFSKELEKLEKIKSIEL